VKRISEENKNHSNVERNVANYLTKTTTTSLCA